jgi:hypothetical protein
VIVLAGFAMWWNQNGGAVVKKEAADTMGSREEVTETVLKDPSKAISTAKDFNLTVKKDIPLKVKRVPEVLTTAVGSWGGGVAGAILMIGAIFAARLVGFTVLLAAAVALFGPKLNLPVIGEPAPGCATSPRRDWRCSASSGSGVDLRRGGPSCPPAFMYGDARVALRAGRRGRAQRPAPTRLTFRFAGIGLPADEARCPQADHWRRTRFRPRLGQLLHLRNQQP